MAGGDMVIAYRIFKPLEVGLMALVFDELLGEYRWVDLDNSEIPKEQFNRQQEAIEWLEKQSDNGSIDGYEPLNLGEQE